MHVFLYNFSYKYFDILAKEKQNNKYYNKTKNIKCMFFLFIYSLFCLSILPIIIPIILLATMNTGTDNSPLFSIFDVEASFEKRILTARTRNYGEHNTNFVSDY